MVVDHKFGAGRALVNGSHEAVDHGARHGLYLCVLWNRSQERGEAARKGRLFARRRMMKGRTARQSFPAEERERGGEENRSEVG